MRSGLHNYLDTYGFRTTFGADPTHIFTPQDLLDLAFAEPMEFAPGDGSDSSNTNTILLGLVAETLDAKPLGASTPIACSYRWASTTRSYRTPPPSVCPTRRRVATSTGRCRSRMRR